MKIPLSKELVSNLILPTIAITGVALYDIIKTGFQNLDKYIPLLIIFGIPMLLFSIFLLHKNFTFKEIEKSRKADRFFKLPINSFTTFTIILLFSLFLFTGIAIELDKEDLSNGFPLLILGLTGIIATSIALDHPKIWFRDTLNIKDLIEENKDIKKEDSSAYKNGNFSYEENHFTILIDDILKIINWNDITQITAYKLDLFSTDIIKISIITNDQTINIDDQTIGYIKFMETASTKLFQFNDNWFVEVAFPAFETNFTTIYKRKDNKNSH